MNSNGRFRMPRVMPPWMKHADSGRLGPPPPPVPSGSSHPPQTPSGTRKLPPSSSPIVEPDYEVIEFPTQQYMNTSMNSGVSKKSDIRRCDLCGSSEAAVCCLNCNNQVFCTSCDDMYHRHPKRQTHTRKSILNVGQENIRPPLPPKGLTSPPVPPPRRNKGQSRNEFGGNFVKNLMNLKGDGSSSLQRMSTRPLPNVPAQQNHPDNRHEIMSKKSMTLSRDPVSNTSLQQRYQKHQEMMRGTAPDLSRDFSNIDIRGDRFNQKNMMANENMWQIDRRGSMPAKSITRSFRNQNVTNNHLMNQDENDFPDDSVHSPPSPQRSLKRETSASVFNLNTGVPHQQMEQHRFNTMAPAQSMAQLGCVNCQHQHHMMGHVPSEQWMPWAARYGSNMSLNMPPEGYPQSPMWMGMGMAPWCGPIPMYPTPMLPPQHTGTSRTSATSRPQSRVHSRAASPAASVRSRRSRISRRANMEHDEFSDEEEMRRPPQRKDSILSSRRKLSSSSTDNPQRSFTPIKHLEDNAVRENKMKPPESPRPKSRSSARQCSSVTTSENEDERKDSIEESSNTDCVPDKLGVPPPPTPKQPWICEYCTFVNEPGVKVCDVCCKTPTAPPQTLNTTEIDLKAKKTKTLSSDENVFNDSETEFKKKKKITKTAPKASPESDSNDESISRVIKGEKANHSYNVTPSPVPDSFLNDMKDSRSPSRISDSNVIIRVRNTKTKAEKVSTGCGPSPPKEIECFKTASQAKSMECATETHFDEEKSQTSKDRSKKEITSTGTSPLPQSISTQTYDVIQKKPESVTDDSKSTQGTPTKSKRFNRSMKRSNSLHNTKMPNDEEPRSNSRKSNRSTSHLSYSSDAHSVPTTPSRDGSPTPSPYNIGYDDYPQRDIKHLGEMGPMRSRSNSLLGNHLRYGIGMGMGLGPTISYRSTVDLRKPDLYRDENWKNSYFEPYMYPNQRNELMNYRGESQPREMGGSSFMMDHSMIQKRQNDVMKSQGMELVKLLREAEMNNFSAEELQIAIMNGGNQNPIIWLKENWPQMIETVLTVATNYGRESKDNNVGTISQIEARDALKKHKGSVWQAVTECVEQRQKKFADLQSKGKFTREEILTCLTAHQGDLDAALLELSKTQLKPFLMRIWGPPSGAENESGNNVSMEAQDPIKDIPHSVVEDGEEANKQKLLKYVKAHADQPPLANEESTQANRLVSVPNSSETQNTNRENHNGSPSSDNQSENMQQAMPSFQLLENIRDLLQDMDHSKTKTVLKDIGNIITKFDNIDQNYNNDTNNLPDNTYGTNNSQNHPNTINQSLESKEVTKRNDPNIINSNQTNLPNFSLSQNVAVENFQAETRNDNSTNNTMDNSNDARCNPGTQVRDALVIKSSEVNNAFPKQNEDENSQLTVAEDDLQRSKKSIEIFQQDESNESQHSNNYQSQATATVEQIENSNKMKQNNEENLGQLANDKIQDKQINAKLVSKNLGESEEESSEDNFSDNKKVENINEIDSSQREVEKSIGQKTITQDSYQESVSIPQQSPANNSATDPSTLTTKKSKEEVEETAKVKEQTNSNGKTETLDNAKTSQPLYDIMQDTQQLIRQMRDELKSDIETYKSSENSSTESDYDDEDDRSSVSSAMPQSTEHDSQSEDESFSDVQSNHSIKSSGEGGVNGTVSKNVEYTSDENERYEEAVDESENDSGSYSEEDETPDLSEEDSHSETEINNQSKKLQILDDLVKDLQQQSDSIDENINNKQKFPIKENGNKETSALSNINDTVEVSIETENPINDIQPTNLNKEKLIVKNDNVNSTVEHNISNMNGEERTNYNDDSESKVADEQISLVFDQNFLNIPFADDSLSSEQESISINEDQPTNLVPGTNISDVVNSTQNQNEDVVENSVTVEVTIVRTSKKETPPATETSSNNLNTPKPNTDSNGIENQTVSIDKVEKEDQTNTSIQSNDHLENKEEIQISQSENIDIPNTSNTNVDKNVSNSSTAIKDNKQNTTSTTTSNKVNTNENSNPNVKKPKSFVSQIPKPDKTITNSKIPTKLNPVKKAAPLLSDKITPFGNFQNGHVKKLQQGLFNKATPALSKTTDKNLPKIPVPINSKTNSETKSTNLKKSENLKTSNQVLQSTATSNKGCGSIKQAKPKQFFIETCLSDDYFTDEDVKLPIKSVTKKQSISPPQLQEVVIKDAEETLPENIIIVNKRQIDLTTIHLKEDSPERQIRMLLAESIVPSWEQAELALELITLKFDKVTALTAANECTTLEAAMAYLEQECELCTGKYPMKEMVSMLKCIHRCCKDCARNYFSIQITDRSILDCTCPYCKLPELHEHNEDEILEYFSNLDILLKSILDEKVHELFQRKLRDRTLMLDPNFRWCVDCSSGFIVNPRQKRHICPDCRTITCAQCGKYWETQHDGISCEKFAEWKELNDPDVQAAGINKHLEDHGINCPKCKFRFALSRGGCMHFTCSQCKYEFCCGCDKPFLMGAKCGLSPYCAKLGLHAHHPRNCLFYLRDKEPRELQTLLQLNSITFKVKPPEGEIDEKPKTRCPVQLQRETSIGLVDGLCNGDIEPNSAGFCKVHYVEYLVGLIKGVDPLPIMDLSEMVAELRRMAIPLPERGPWDTDPIYAEMCSKIIKDHIPLD